MNVKLCAIFVIAALSSISLAQNPFAGQTPVKAELKKAISSKDKVGTEFTASTSQDVTLGSIKLPRGTILMGHVVSVTTHSKVTPDGSVTIIFDHAKPKKGDEVAISASLYQIMPADDSMQRSDVAGMRGNGSSSPGSAQTGLSSEDTAAMATRSGTDDSKRLAALVSNSSAPVKVVSAIPGVALAAVVSPEKSGVLVSKNGDVYLLAGINLVIGVAPAAK